VGVVGSHNFWRQFLLLSFLDRAGLQSTIPNRNKWIATTSRVTFFFFLLTLDASCFFFPPSRLYFGEVGPTPLYLTSSSSCLPPGLTLSDLPSSLCGIYERLTPVPRVGSLVRDVRARTIGLYHLFPDTASVVPHFSLCSSEGVS